MQKIESLAHDKIVCWRLWDTKSALLFQMHDKLPNYSINNSQNSYGQFVYFCAWWMIEQSFLSNCQFAHDQTWNVSLKKSISSQPMHDMDNIALALLNMIQDHTRHGVCICLKINKIK